MLQKLNLPEYSFRIKTTEQRKYIFDNIRKRYVLLTPEEWVRQNFASYLIMEKNYPASLIAVEMTLNTNRMVRRADIVIFSKTGAPLVIVECKAPGVTISQAVFDQVANYNMGMKVNYLVVSNGLIHYCARLYHREKRWEFLKQIPDYSTLALSDY